MQQLANPGRFLRLARPFRPYITGIACLTLLIGLYYALFGSPADRQQSETVRIMYLHVPSAWMALSIYASMGISAFVSLIWKHPLADIYCKAAAPLGAFFTLMCLVTGSLWGKPMWGTWWVWDARLTSVFILLLIYLGYIALIHAFESEEKGLFLGAILLIAGLVNLPIIKFSVDWLNTLHQPASLTAGKISIAPEMLRPLFIMGISFNFIFAALVLLRMETLVTKRKVMRHLLQESFSYDQRPST